MRNSKGECMITFYTTKGKYGCFSNFSNDTFKYVDLIWQTSEHAFQAMKFYPKRMDAVELIHATKSPKLAAQIGRDRKYPLRQDWDSWHGLSSTFSNVNDSRALKLEPAIWRVKDMIMYEVLKEKFQQNPYIAKTLLETEKEDIVEDSAIDSYWGWGKDHAGQNKLGRILMLVRDWLIQNK